MSVTRTHTRSQSDDEDTLQVFGERSHNKALHLSDMELTDSDESSGISMREYAADLEPNGT